MANDELLTVQQVADRLKMHPATVREWLRTGHIKGIRLGADKLGWRVRESALQAFIAEREARSGDGAEGDA